MKLIIDIPEVFYEYCKAQEDAIEIQLAVKNGIPLDDLRAEIEQNAYPIVHGVNNHEKGMTLYGILQIIDKYKAESEE